MKQDKGYTLVETLMVILLVVCIGFSVQVGNHMLRETRLKAKGNEIAEGIYYANHCAQTTGKMYNTLCFKNRILVREGNLSPAIFTIQIEPSMNLNATKSGMHIIFNGRKAIDKAGTIYLYDHEIGKQVRITIGVATNKVRVYYEKIRTK